MFRIDTRLTPGATGWTWTLYLELGGRDHIIASGPKTKIYPSHAEALGHAGELVANMLADSMKAGLERTT